MKIKRILPAFLFLGLTSTVLADQKGFTVDDLVNLERISSASISPDDKNVVYVVRKTDMQNNRGRTDIWVSPTHGGKAKQLTSDLASDHSPKWSKDSKQIYFLSSRSGSSQIWRVGLNGNKPIQVTDLSVDVTSFKISSNNEQVVFSSRVYPECKNFQCTVTKDKLEKEKQTSGVVYDKMFVRHWDHWIDGRQSQLFLINLAYEKVSDSAKIIPISKSVNANVPSDPFGGDE
ncbi:MAG: S9 family peptidase, partial [Kangiellaceae bacterium]|nr:S9 family peptidase [Kangiellaceae bacterium]